MNGVKKPDIRKALCEEFRKIPKGKSVALLLSAGMDSHATLLALQDVGITPHCYSFMVDRGKLSTDFKYANFKAKKLGVKFTPVFLPHTQTDIVSRLVELVQHGAKTKTEFECSLPVMETIKVIQEPYIVTGHGAGGHFAITKKAMIHFEGKIEQWRSLVYKKFNAGTYVQKAILESICKIHNKTFLWPWFSSCMQNEFSGTTWDQINRPKKKQAIIDNFPEMRKFKIFPASNLQLGDSGIATIIGKAVLSSKYNTRNFKSPVGAYNEIVRQHGKSRKI